MSTANERLFDVSIRHAIGVQRYTAGEVREMLIMLKKAERDLQKKLSARLVQGDWTSRRYQTLMQDIKAMRKALFAQLHSSSRVNLLKLAKAEQQFTRGMLQSALPFHIDFATASAQTLNTLVTAQPFSGGTHAAKTLGQWWTGVAAADQSRITGAIQLGMIQGESVPQMVGRVMQSQTLTRANAETVVRTAVNHVSNSSRDAFFKENSDIVEMTMWVSTLDGRTTMVCMDRDGSYDSVTGENWDRIPEPHLDPPGAAPPAHPRCRSVKIAILDAENLSKQLPSRAYVRDTRTNRMRAKDFRADAREQVGKARWKRMSVKQRNRAITKQKKAWTAESIGHVPAKVNYEQWLRRQPASFQNDVLGIAKGKAFRKGLKINQFLDKQGNELTLVQLQALFPTYISL